MTFGTVTSVESDTLGSELLAAATVGATTLAVDFTVDFNETGGLLLLNGVELEYTTIDPDAHTITLATPLTVAADVDDPVSVVEAGAVAVEWTANVTLDEGDTVAAVIPTALIGYFPEGTYDEPVTVELVLRNDTYEVASQPIRDASFDGGVVWNPRTTRTVTAASIPDSSFTQLTAWTTDEVDGLIDDDGVNIVYPGTYLVLARASFATNGTGRRSINIKLNGVATESFTTAADSGGFTHVPVFDSVRTVEGDKITIEVFQSSGAALAVNGGSLNVFRVSS